MSEQVDEPTRDETTEEVISPTAEAALPWRGLHPASMVVNLLPQTWRFVRSMWPLLLALFYGGRNDGTRIVDISILGLFLFMTLGQTVIHYITLRYRMAGGRLEITSGLLWRQARVISPDRIQNTELVRNVFHRLSGLVEVRIETASGTEVEGLLSALSEEDAARLVEKIEAAQRRTRHDAHVSLEEPPVITTNSVADLIRFGLTSTRLGATAVVLGLALEATQIADPEQLEELGVGLGLLGTVLLILAVMTGSWFAGTVGSVIRHFGFRISARTRSLIAEEGLFTRRRVELPIAKVQVVTVSEPFLRRLVGIGTVHITTAAAREDGGGTQQAEAMVPVVATEALSEIVHAALPSVDVDLESITLNPPHPLALHRSLIGGFWRAAVLAIGLGWWFWPWGLLAILLIPISLILAWLDHKHQGWLITPEVVITRSGYLHRQTQVFARRKLQSSAVRQGPILTRWGLGRTVLRSAGSSVFLPILSWKDALEIQQRLLPRPATEDPCPEVVIPASP